MTWIKQPGMKNPTGDILIDAIVRNMETAPSFERYAECAAEYIRLTGKEPPAPYVENFIHEPDSVHASYRGGAMGVSLSASGLHFPRQVAPVPVRLTWRQRLGWFWARVVAEFKEIKWF